MEASADLGCSAIGCMDVKREMRGMMGKQPDPSHIQ